MFESPIALSQMTRTTLAVNELKKNNLPYIICFTDPTAGGITASFAMLGDIQLAESGAIIGFAGRRVIEETLREKLPDDFQTAEYLQDHGMVDMVVARSEQKQKIDSILSMLMESRAA